MSDSASANNLESAVAAARKDLAALISSLTTALESVSDGGAAAGTAPGATGAPSASAAAVAASMTDVRASVSSALAARDARDATAAAGESADALDGVEAGLKQRREELRNTVREENVRVGNVIREIRTLVREIGICAEVVGREK